MTAFSYQLYSSRMFPPLADTMQMLADLGYASVEGYGALVADPHAVNALDDAMRDTGLTMPTCHVGLEMCQSDPEAVIAIAKRLGAETVVIPFIMPGDRPTDAAGWAAYGAGLRDVAKVMADAGLTLAYHNHDFEFQPLPDGTLPMDILVGAADGVQVEYDVAWAVRAGADPMTPIESYGNRILAAHLKDIASQGTCEDEDGWADLGHGTIDWPTIFAALKAAGTRHFIMEHDNPSDHHRFASRALAAARAF